MKSAISKGIAALFILILALSACAPRATITPENEEIARKTEAERVAKEELEAEKRRRESFSLAEKSFHRDNMEKAEGLYRSYAENYPDDSLADDAYFKLGEIALKRDDTEGAIESFGKIVADYVGSDLFMEAKYRLALAYFKKGEYSDTIESLKSILGLSLEKERRIAVTTTIADAHLKDGVNMEALAWYVKALGLDPKEETKERITARARDVVGKKLSEEELQAAALSLDGSAVGEYAAYHLIIRKVERGLYEEAKADVEKLLPRLHEEEVRLKTEEILQVIVQRMDVNADTIGCILPLSGRFAAYGRKVLKGVQLAAGVFGGDEGIPVRLVIRDSKGDPEEALKALLELVDDEKAVAIVGPLISDVAESIAAVAQKKGIPMVALSKKAGLPETGDYIFRNFLTNRQQTRTLARYAVKEMGLGKFAILYPTDSYGNELMNLFWNDVTLEGGEVVGIEGYGGGQYDFGKEIKRLVGMDRVNKEKEEEKPENERVRPVVDFDAIFIPDSYEKAALIAPQLVYNDIENVRLLGTNSWDSAKLVEIGGEYVRGAVFTAGFYPGSARESTLNFSIKFEESFGEKPGTLEAMAFDATSMLVRFIKEKKAKSRVEMRDALLKIENYDGATGKTTVMENGDMDKELFVLTVKGTEIVEVERVEPSPAGEDLPEGDIPLLQED